MKYSKNADVIGQNYYLLCNFWPNFVVNIAYDQFSNQEISDMKKHFTLLVVAIFMGILLTGCKKKPGDPPVLPPAESMAIDFSNFENSKKSADIILPKGIEDSNWGVSALVAGYWKAVIYFTLAVPVYSFEKAIEQKPVYLDDRTWQWDYTVPVFTVNYHARLTGQIRDNDVLWKMYITKDGAGGFNDFMWFEGTSDLDGKGGKWTLYHSYAFQEPVLEIDWEGNGSDVTYVRYTYVRALNDSRVDDPFRTSFIEYGKLTSGAFDSYYTIRYYNGSGFSDMDVEWSSAGHNGRVSCLPLFEDTLDPTWHCWDMNYVNITCP